MTLNSSSFGPTIEHNFDNKVGLSELQWLFEGSSNDVELSEDDSLENINTNLAQESDSSDQGSLLRVGSINYNKFYKDFKHSGYDIEGNKVILSQKGDSIDLFLLKKEKDSLKRTLYDPLNDRVVKLTESQLKLINRIRHGKTAGKLFEPFIKDIQIKKTAFPNYQPKRSFLPSKVLNKKILGIMKSIRNGWIRFDKLKEEEREVYDLWDQDWEDKKRQVLIAPKSELPGHAQSYNPPMEYLLQKNEKNIYNFVPEINSIMRHVGAYENLVEERFERCLDLYLSARYKKQRLDVDPESLLPKLPETKSLKPFPEFNAIDYRGHKSKIGSLSITPCGQWLLSASDDKTVRIWEVSTGREFRRYEFQDPIKFVEAHPFSPIFAVIVKSKIILIPEPLFGDTKNFNKMFLREGKIEKKNSCIWRKIDVHNVLIRHGGPYLNKAIEISASKDLYRLSWHSRGDFLASISQLAQATSLLIHKISTNRSQQPFLKHIGVLQDLSFHPSLPHLVVASNQWIRIYNLSRQVLFKKLKTTSTHISKFDIHPLGNHLLIGCHDSHVFLYDTKQSLNSFKNLRYHKQAVRAVSFHKKRPLCVSGGDDGSIHIFYTKVFKDFPNEPLVIPLRILRGHDILNDGGILDCIYHPIQPWLFSCGVDHKIILWM